MALFGVSVSGVLAFVYYTTVGVIVRQTDETIQTEIQSLAEYYADNGLPGLVDVIQRRSSSVSGERGIYLLADPGFERIAGNLVQWPEVARGEPGWVDFLVRSERGDIRRPQIARARTFVLPGGFRLLIGRDLTERELFQDYMTDALFAALGLAVVLGLLGGFLMSRDLLRRLDAINRSCRAIIQGNLQERMPVKGTDDEFDRLARNLNAMLDRIHELMVGMRQVTDNIAHDLRSPISRMRSRLEIALRGQPDVEACREAMQETIEESDTILATFNALLSIALAESGVPREQFERVDLAAIARDALDLYAPLAEDKSQTLEAEIQDGAEISGNRQLLLQALINLIDNAIKYTPSGGRIRLEVAPTKDKRIVAVADDGPGIPAESRDAVLERFARLDASRETPGSGLGLSLVGAVARLHGAELRLEDNRPGLKVSLVFEAASTHAG